MRQVEGSLKYRRNSTIEQHLLSQTLQVPRFSLHRDGAPGHTWPPLSVGSKIKELYPFPVFIFLECARFDSLLENDTSRLVATAYLFDAVEGCRLSEELILDTSTTGVFRISSRKRDLAQAQNFGSELESFEHTLPRQLLPYVEGVFLVIHVSKNSN